MGLQGIVHPQRSTRTTVEYKVGLHIVISGTVRETLCMIFPLTWSTCGSFGSSSVLRWTLSIPMGRGNWEEHERGTARMVGGLWDKIFVKAGCLAHRVEDRPGDSFEDYCRGGDIHFQTRQDKGRWPEAVTRDHQVRY